MGFTDIRRNNLLVGDDLRLLGAVVVGSVIGGGLSRLLIDLLLSDALVLVLLPYFVISVFVSFSGGGLLESFVLLVGPPVGFYSHYCLVSLPMLFADPEPSLRSFPELLFACPVANAPSPVVAVILTASAVIALLLSIASVGLGRFLRARFDTSWE